VSKELLIDVATVGGGTCAWLRPQLTLVSAVLNLQWLRHQRFLKIVSDPLVDKAILGLSMSVLPAWLDP
jgi:hypothetical protein